MQLALTISEAVVYHSSEGWNDTPKVSFLAEK